MAESYEARRDDDEAKKQHDHENAKKTTKAVAKGAVLYLGGGEVGAKAVDLVANTKLGNKVLDVASKPIESSKVAKGVNNALNDSGAVDLADKAMSANAGGGAGSPGGGTGAPGGGAGGTTPGQTPNQVKTGANSAGGEQGSSLPSSGGDKAKNIPGGGGSSHDEASQPKEDSSDSGSQEEKKDSNLFKNIVLTGYIQMVIFSAAPFLLFLILILLVVFAATDVFSDYEDAIGISSTTGEETGGIVFNASSPEQQDFFDRVISVKNSYQSSGKTVDALKVVAVYHVLNHYGAGLTYDDMTDSKIREIADAMFSGNSYNEDTFKTNLINNIIPKYLPNTTQEERETIADAVFEYIENYY